MHVSVAGAWHQPEAWLQETFSTGVVPGLGARLSPPRDKARPAVEERLSYCREGREKIFSR